MTQNIHTRIKHLLEETSDAFASSGTINMDYAGFAAMALSDFKSLLDNPDLTDMELRCMIRKVKRNAALKTLMVAGQVLSPVTLPTMRTRTKT